MSGDSGRKNGINSKDCIEKFITEQQKYSQRFYDLQQQNESLNQRVESLERLVTQSTEYDNFKLKAENLRLLQSNQSLRKELEKIKDENHALKYKCKVKDEIIQDLKNKEEKLTAEQICNDLDALQNADPCNHGDENSDCDEFTNVKQCYNGSKVIQISRVEDSASDDENYQSCSEDKPDPVSTTCHKERLDQRDDRDYISSTQEDTDEQEHKDHGTSTVKNKLLNHNTNKHLTALDEELEASFESQQYISSSTPTQPTDDVNYDGNFQPTHNTYLMEIPEQETFNSNHKERFNQDNIDDYNSTTDDQKLKGNGENEDENVQMSADLKHALETHKQTKLAKQKINGGILSGGTSWNQQENQVDNLHFDNHKNTVNSVKDKGICLQEKSYETKCEPRDDGLNFVKEFGDDSENDDDEDLPKGIEESNDNHNMIHGMSHIEPGSNMVKSHYTGMIKDNNVDYFTPTDSDMKVEDDDDLDIFSNFDTRKLRQGGNSQNLSESMQDPSHVQEKVYEQSEKINSDMRNTNYSHFSIDVAGEPSQVHRQLSTSEQTHANNDFANLQYSPSTLVPLAVENKVLSENKVLENNNISLVVNTSISGQRSSDKMKDNNVDYFSSTTASEIKGKDDNELNKFSNFDTKKLRQEYNSHQNLSESVQDPNHVQEGTDSLAGENENFLQKDRRHDNNLDLQYDRSTEKVCEQSKKINSDMRDTNYSHFSVDVAVEQSDIREVYRQLSTSEQTHANNDFANLQYSPSTLLPLAVENEVLSENEVIENSNISLVVNPSNSRERSSLLSEMNSDEYQNLNNFHDSNSSHTSNDNHLREYSDSNCEWNSLSHENTVPNLFDRDQLQQTATIENQQSHNSKTSTYHRRENLGDERDVKEVLLIYHKEIQMWIERQLYPTLSKNSPEKEFTWLHTATCSKSRYEWVVDKIRECSKIMVILSEKFMECDLCNYAIGYIVSNQMFRGKMVLIKAEECLAPPIVSHIVIMTLNNPNFWENVSKHMNEEPQEKSATAHLRAAIQPVSREWPCLLVKTRPANPIEGHFQKNISIPSTPDKRNDSRAVFVVNLYESCTDEHTNYFDKSDKCKRCPKYCVKVGDSKVYRYVKDNPIPVEIDRGEYTKCVRWWEDKYRQPHSKEEIVNEFAFYIRLKIPHYAHKLLVYLQFDLMQIDPRTQAETVVHSVILDFETKVKKVRRKQLNPFPKRRTHGNFGDDEDPDDENIKESRKDEARREGLNSPVDSQNRNIKSNSKQSTESPEDYVHNAKSTRSDIPHSVFSFLGEGAKPKPGNPFYGFTNSKIRKPPSTVPDLSLAADPPHQDSDEDDDERDLPKITVAEKTENNQNSQQKVTNSKKELALEKRISQQERMYTAQEWIDAEDILKRVDFGISSKYGQGPIEGLFTSKKYFDLVVTLEKLAEGVKDPKVYSEFMKLADSYLDRFRTKQRSDEKIVVLLKKCGVEHYVNRLSNASGYIREALELLPRAKYRNRLEARIYYYISTIYREKKKFGKAKHWIKKSKDLLATVEPGEDTAKAFYNEGRLYMKMLLASSKYMEFRYAATRCFELAIDHATHEHDQYGTRLDVKLIRRCLLNNARIYVDMPETAVGRNRSDVVNLEDIEKATSCLSTLREPRYLHNISKRNRVQFLLAEAAVSYRRARLFCNMKTLEKGNELSIAQVHIGKAVEKAATARALAGEENFKEQAVAEEFERFLSTDSIFVSQNNKTNYEYIKNYLSTNTSSSSPNEDGRKKSSVVITEFPILSDPKSGEDSSVKDSDVY